MLLIMGQSCLSQGANSQVLGLDSQVAKTHEQSSLFLGANSSSSRCKFSGVDFGFASSDRSGTS